MKNDSTSTISLKLSKLLVGALLAGAALHGLAADLLDTVKERGTLRIAVEGTYPPYNFKDQDDLKGKKLGVGQGSNFEQKAKAVGGIDVKSYPGAPEYLQDLATGRIDAALNDSLMVAYLLKTSNLPIKAGAPIGTVEKM